MVCQLCTTDQLVCDLLEKAGLLLALFETVVNLSQHTLLLSLQVIYILKGLSALSFLEIELLYYVIGFLDLPLQLVVFRLNFLEFAFVLISQPTSFGTLGLERSLELSYLSTEFIIGDLHVLHLQDQRSTVGFEFY